MAAFDSSPENPDVPVMNHASEMPELDILPEDAISTKEYLSSFEDDDVTNFIRQLQNRLNPIEVRPSRHFHPINPEPAPPDKQLWVRVLPPFPAQSSSPTNTALNNQRLLLYLSDYGLVSTALQPHGASVWGGAVQVASLDHTIHFHRTFDDMDFANDWFLHCTESPSSSGGRGFCRGSLYRYSTGELLASTAQEGITRWRETQWNALKSPGGK